MQKLIEHAKKGRRAALTELYEKYRKEAKFVAYALLGDTEASGYAVVWAFKNTWEGLSDGSISDETDFRKYLLGKVSVYCRKKTGKKGQKSLPLPPGKNFAVSGSDVENAVFENGALDAVLRTLPLAGRFIFVLGQIAGFSQKEIASLTGLNEKTVGDALEAEAQNITCIMDAVSKQSGDYSRSVSDLLDEAVLSGIQEADLLDAHKNQILESIDVFAGPLEKKRKRKGMIYAGTAVAAALVLGIVIWFAANNRSAENTDQTGKTEESSLKETEQDEIRADYYAEISVEDYGTITVALNKEAAPKTVENFVALAESGFYDGLTFHRIIEGFMMQGGDPDGNGMGGSDQTIVGEFTANGHENPLLHTRGAISMARSREYDSASSQFFIVHKDSASLDGQYAVFGYVTEGMEVVDEICTKAEPVDGDGTIPAENQPVISTVKIREAK